jgi:predicted ferric reductase
MLFKKQNEQKRKKVLKRKWFRGFFPIEPFDALKRQQLLSPGFFLTIFLILSSILLWLFHNPDSIRNPIIALAKLNAFLAISTLSVNFILAARFKIFERLFYGLDRMYRVHKFIGRLSLFFILFHPIFLIMNSYPDTSRIIPLMLPVGPLEVTIGVIAVYLFLLLIILTVAINIPYHLWKLSHKGLGFVLFLAGCHALFAGSDINSFPPLKTYIIILVSVGILSWLYMLVFYKRFGPKFNVTIDKVVHLKKTTELYFTRPETFNYQPGQFVFTRFPVFEGFKELFPFSISTDPSKKHIRLSIKQSGDYTSNIIPRLQKDDKAVIMGPYGRFGQRYLKHDKNMIWIAGGIGITPFLSLAKHESLFPTNRNIHLIWVVRNQDEAFHDHELKEESLKNEKFTYDHWFSDEQGRITADDITKLIGGKEELRKRLIFMCGPPPMTYSLSKGFYKKGLSYRHIIFEDFNMLD